MSNIKASAAFGVPKISLTTSFNLTMNVRRIYMRVLRRPRATLLTDTDAATIWFAIAIVAIVLLAILYDLP